ncbi:hypothetical protein [Pragia fontium]|uniref:hypothetical protein n=1 Tax=Pragia fontium TaxID=82985 RepID=UPI000F6B3E58|nr:hypothetical protein [Pragia fontium]VEJ54588.1 Uncharacterised protein [Pragia fontium]
MNIDKLDKRIAAFTDCDIDEVNAQAESWHGNITNENIRKMLKHLPGFDAELFEQAIEEDAMKDEGSLNYALHALLYRVSELALAKEAEHKSHEFDEVA